MGTTVLCKKEVVFNISQSSGRLFGCVFKCIFTKLFKEQNHNYSLQSNSYSELSVCSENLFRRKSIVVRLYCNKTATSGTFRIIYCRVSTIRTIVNRDTISKLNSISYPVSYFISSIVLAKFLTAYCLGSFVGAINFFFFCF